MHRQSITRLVLQTFFEIDPGSLLRCWAAVAGTPVFDFMVSVVQIMYNNRPPLLPEPPPIPLPTERQVERTYRDIMNRGMEYDFYYSWLATCTVICWNN